ncbi:MAG: hypothetical protein LC739_00230 [Actinobacteria bacterium]|nr:hypothetical protein [Acidimicrobiia bacterium]MCA1734582.1 hypothetical protein [Actinomycetota bacterium]MDQ3500543.1 hypothetical protein [Actinomycetota bacterium]
MRRVEKKLLKVLDELEALATQRRLVEAELEAHRHINDDAQRDAAMGIDRLEALSTRAEVTRFKRLAQDIALRQRQLEETKTRLMSQLHG